MGLTAVFISFIKSHYFYPINLKVKILNTFMISVILGLSHQPFSCPLAINMDQMYELKIKDYQLFFTQAYGTEFNYSPSLDLSADNLSN